MGKGQQQRILFGFWIMGLAHKQCRGELELLQLLLYCQDVCVRILCYPFLDCPCLFKETMELLNVCRKMIFQLLCLYICELWIAMFFSFSFWISLMKEGPEHLGVLSGKMTFLLFIGVCLSTARPWLFFSSPLLCSEPCYWTGGIAMPDTWQKARLEGEEWGQPLT